MTTDCQKTKLIEEIDVEIADAFTFAKTSPFPSVANWEALNYSSTNPLIEKYLGDFDFDNFDSDQPESLPSPY